MPKFSLNFDITSASKQTHRLLEICRDGNGTTSTRNRGHFCKSHYSFYYIKIKNKTTRLNPRKYANNDKAGCSRTQEGEAHAYLDYVDSQDMEMATNANGNGIDTHDTDATNTDTETEMTTYGTSQASEGKKNSKMA